MSWFRHIICVWALVSWASGQSPIPCPEGTNCRPDVTCSHTCFIGSQIVLAKKECARRPLCVGSGIPCELQRCVKNHLPGLRCGCRHVPSPNPSQSSTPSPSPKEDKSCPDVCYGGKAGEIAMRECRSGMNCEGSGKLCHLQRCQAEDGQDGLKCGCPDIVIHVSPTPTPIKPGCSDICYVGKAAEIAMRECRSNIRCAIDGKECTLQECDADDGRVGLKCGCTFLTTAHLPTANFPTV